VSVRDKGDLVRPYLEDQIAERRYRISFDIEFRLYKRTDFTYVRVADVTLVRAGMDSDSFRPETFDTDSSLCLR